MLLTLPSPNNNNININNNNSNILVKTENIDISDPDKHFFSKLYNGSAIDFILTFEKMFGPTMKISTQNKAVKSLVINGRFSEHIENAYSSYCSPQNRR